MVALAAAIAGLWGCGAMPGKETEPAAPPDMLIWTMRQYAVRGEFAETQPLIKARNWAGLAALGRKKLELQPTRGEWWQVAGYGYLQAGDLAQARDCLARASRLLPEEVGIMNLYAATLIRQGETRAASQALDRALQIDPTSGVAWVLSGDLHNSAGRLREARSAYERAIEIDGRDVFAWLALGNLAKKANDTTTVERAVAALVSIYPPFAKELGSMK
jgi:cytochrome c-type biogenesis protein CcmH/NrfG